MQEKTPQLSVAASLCKLLLNRMLEKFIDQHSQCLCYVVEPFERRVPPSAQPLADHRLRDVHALSELFGIYVFSHITFSSCSCDSYFFCFIAFILKMIHKNGTANAVPQMCILHFIFILWIRLHQRTSVLSASSSQYILVPVSPTLPLVISTPLIFSSTTSVAGFIYVFFIILSSLI